MSIPVLAIVFLLLVQVAVVMLDQLAVTQVAREAARAAAVSPSPRVAVAAGREATRLKADRLDIAVGPRNHDGMVHITVTYRSRVVMPVTDVVLFEPVVTAKAAMAVEDD